MKRTSYLRVFTVGLCGIAALVSYKLLAKHVTGRSGSAWFDAACPDEVRPGGANCAAVLASPYSYFPPKKPGDHPTTPHLPVAFLGLIYFSALGVWMIGVGQPSRERRWLHLPVLLIAGFGLAWSARFTYIMFSQLSEWCAWCMVTHACNAALVVCLILLWPRKQKRAASDAPPQSMRSAEPGTEKREPRSHPSLSRAIGTLAAIMAVSYGNFGASSVLATRKAAATLDQCMEAIARVQGDTERLVELWLTSPKQPIVIRPDDPVRSGTGTEAKTVELVVFSDFQCPSCARFAALVDESIAPLFGGRLRIVFKHYPIDRICNPLVSTTMHKNACRAAQLAEAARVQGGADAFWSAHDHLFQSRRNGDELGTLDPLALAEQLGLDGVQLAADADAEIVGQRIKEDAELARKCHVRGTPAVFVEARRVDPLAISDLRFWDRLADWFWRSVDEERPKTTKLGALNSKRP